METFTSRMTRQPLAHDAARLAVTSTGPFAALLAGVAGSSPYLARLIERQPDWVAEISQSVPEVLFAGLLDRLDQDVASAAAIDDVGRTLRQAKSQAALLIALADLAGVWSLQETTATLSAFADRCVSSAANRLLQDAIRRKKLPGLTEADLSTGAGYCVLAMGKHGAGELNYSSDIDLICLFDQSRFDPPDFAEAKNGYVRVTRALVKLIGEATEAGYVFRIDLRLRPSPSTTPVCLAMEAAERYYESVGRTWERAAHIKARPIAGDIAAGEAYLERLTPFVWRRYLDFAAIAETHGMLRKIRETKGRFTRDALAGTDIKLSPGGIREIEFFAQTRQLIQGGREPRLRQRKTLDTLRTMADLELISDQTAATLSASYCAHRELEHRLQMIEDAQTHTIPMGQEARQRVACLMGIPDVAVWEQAITARMAEVHALTETFFAPDATYAGVPTASPQFDALASDRRDDTQRLIARWREGEIAATRDDRARRLYLGLEPRILRELGDAGDPDEAVVAFDRFIGGLPAGVQVFSLFTANPHLLDLIVRICALAPRLASYLGRVPQVLDALLDRDFFEPLDDADALTEALSAQLDGIGDYERLLDASRRWAREQNFRVGVQLLVKVAKAGEAAGAYSAIAEASIRALLPRVTEDFARRHGPPPGRGLAVIAMGKLGSGEMTASSDLDLIMVYDAAGAEMSEGTRPLGISAYYPRLTQALLSSLTAPTAEGRLYEVDMRLRPSGRQGPVAVSLESFRRYQHEVAWVWEHMALTRARVVAGPTALSKDLQEEIRTILARRKADPAVMIEAGEMRARLIENWSATPQDRWELKGDQGGLLDIEFCAQGGMLATGQCRQQRPVDALEDLARSGWLDEGDADHLAHSHRIMQGLQQLERLALDGTLSAGPIGPGLMQRLSEKAGLAAGEDLPTHLADRRRKSADIIARAFVRNGSGADQD